LPVLSILSATPANLNVSFVNCKLKEYEIDGHVVRVKAKRNAAIMILIGKAGGNNQLGRPRYMGAQY
jgi:hypothetical protein